jgi:hypothetical protein
MILLFIPVAYAGIGNNNAPYFNGGMAASLGGAGLGSFVTF